MSVPPRTDDPTRSTPGAVLQDEASLRRAFEAHYHGLVADAQRELDTAAALAPRVVEGAFVRAWTQRESILGDIHLRTFLKDEVHHGVARALSRRAAAHRLGHRGEADAAMAPRASGGAVVDAHAADAAVATVAQPAVAPDLETSWAHVTHMIHGGEHSAEAHAVAHEHSRHTAATHVAHVGTAGSWKVPVIIGVLAIAGIAAAMLYVDKVSEDSNIRRAVSGQDVRQTASFSGRPAVVTLGDGTRVRLAPESRISIPKEFGPKVRAVKLDGGATFEPAAGQEKPFRVVARDAMITATGTAFSVRAWEGDPDVVVQVREGSVTVAAGEESRTVAAGQSLAIAGTTMRAPTAEELSTSMAWTADSLVITDRPLGEVVPMLRRWYNLDVKIADSALAKRPVTLRAPLTSAREAVAAVERTAKVKYGYVGRDLAFKDAEAAPAAAPRRPR